MLLLVEQPHGEQRVSTFLSSLASHLEPTAVYSSLDQMLHSVILYTIENGILTR